MKEKRILFWSLVLAVVVVLNLPPPAALKSGGVLRDTVSPYQNTLSILWQHSRGFLSRLGRSARLARERQSLEMDVAILKQRVRELEHFERENVALRRQLGFSILAPQRLILCEVIGRGDVSGWWQTIRLNKGRRDGIVPGMAVMTAEGLIGRTIDAAANTCEVLLITDPNSKVATKIEDSDAFGIARGRGIQRNGSRWAGLEMLAAIRPVELNYLPASFAIKQGDQVVTSGKGHVYPEGLPVGRVVSVKPHESGLYQQATVIPSAQMHALRYVFVVME